MGEYSVVMEERGKTGARDVAASAARPSRWAVAWAWVQVLARFPRAWVLAGGLLWLGFLGIGGLITESGNAFDLFFKPANPPIVWQPLDPAEFDDQDAGFLLGLDHYNKREFADAERVWAGYARHGHAEAQYRLGRMYDFGWGVTQDYRTAADWYRKASEGGHAEAMASLGVSYGLGEGVPRNYQRAAYWYKRSMEAGSKWGAWNFAAILREGRSIERNVDEAIKIERALADMGFCKAHRALGYFHAWGEGGVKADTEKAYRHLKTADLLGCGGGVTLFLMNFWIDPIVGRQIDAELSRKLD